MGYHHKREECSKDTQEVLQNIVSTKQTEYDLAVTSETIEVTSSAGDTIRVQEKENVLTAKHAQILGNSDDPAPSEVEQTVATEDGAGTEYYKTLPDIAFHFEELSDAYVRKRRHSNKVSTDIDYSDI